jgi:hypothetical protein
VLALTPLLDEPLRVGVARPARPGFDLRRGRDLAAVRSCRGPRASSVSSRTRCGGFAAKRCVAASSAPGIPVAVLGRRDVARGRAGGGERIPASRQSRERLIDGGCRAGGGRGRGRLRGCCERPAGRGGRRSSASPEAR